MWGGVVRRVRPRASTTRRCWATTARWRLRAYARGWLRATWHTHCPSHPSSTSPSSPAASPTWRTASRYLPVLSPPAPVYISTNRVIKCVFTPVTPVVSGSAFYCIVCCGCSILTLMLCSLWVFWVSIRELSGSIPEFHQMLVSSTIIYKKIYKYSISLSSCTSSARPEPWCGRGVYIKAVWCPAGPQQRAAVVRGTVHPGAPWLRLPRQVAARRHGCACALRTYAWLLPADTGTSLSYSL